MAGQELGFPFPNLCSGARAGKGDVRRLSPRIACANFHCQVKALMAHDGSVEGELWGNLIGAFHALCQPPVILL